MGRWNFMGTYMSELEKLFGIEYIGFKGQDAIDKLLKEQQGHIKMAFWRYDLGWIDALWGNEEVGLKHILVRRAEQGIDGYEFLKDVAEVIEKGKLRGKNERGNYEIWYNQKMVVIAPEFKGHKVTLLLTSYRQRKEAKPLKNSL